MATCPVCNTQFRPRRPSQKSCSRACRDALQRGVVRGPRDRRVSFFCPQCGKLAQVNKRGALCAECRRPKRICVKCGNAFEAEAPSSSQKFCSRQCSLQVAIKVRPPVKRGPAHHLWKGGHALYRGPKWTQISKAIRARDNQTCQKCGRTDAPLDVHHITRPDDLTNWDEANLPENLVTLCDDCHAHEHKGTGTSQTPESRRAYQRAYQAKNRERLNAYSATWHRKKRREHTSTSTLT